MTPAEQYFRDTLAQIAKEAQQDAYRAAFRLEEYERRHGFKRKAPDAKKSPATDWQLIDGCDWGDGFTGFGPYTPVSVNSRTARLNPEQAYTEVTGRTTYAGAENTKDRPCT